jgi:molecular chaperone DnaJ
MDYYLLLGLGPGATEGEIKRAYRRLARKFHPDINPGDQAAEIRFRRILEAYETLVDPQRRRLYDAGTPGVEQEDPSLSFDGFDFSVIGDNAAGATFSELFADVFRRSAGLDESRPLQGSDIHANVSLTFEESVRGAERRMTITRQEACALCAGGGAVRTAEGQCLSCRGGGSIRWTRGHMVFSRACTACGGTGRLRQQTCASCAGHGVQPRTESVLVKFSPGIGDGTRVRVPGRGHAGRFGGATGDLVVAVHVAAHPLYERDGDDLYVRVPIAVHEAALGAKIAVPTPDGPARLRVPPGTQGGQRFRLHGRGVAKPDGRAGDLIVEVRIVVPQLRDERSRELMREFARLNSENVRKDLGV